MKKYILPIMATMLMASCVTIPAYFDPITTGFDVIINGYAIKRK